MISKAFTSEDVDRAAVAVLRWVGVPATEDDDVVARLSEQASEMTAKVFGSGSYEEALGIIGEYVNITSVDEPCEDIDLKMG